MAQMGADTETQKQNLRKSATSAVKFSLEGKGLFLTPTIGWH
jgi:hypothetical protein